MSRKGANCLSTNVFYALLLTCTANFRTYNDEDIKLLKNRLCLVGLFSTPDLLEKYFLRYHADYFFSLLKLFETRIQTYIEISLKATEEIIRLATANSAKPFDNIDHTEDFQLNNSKAEASSREYFSFNEYLIDRYIPLMEKVRLEQSPLLLKF